MIRISKLLGITLLLAMILVACGGGDSNDDNNNTDADNNVSVDTPENTDTDNETPAPTADTTVQEQSSLPLNDAGTPIVARVNGDEITLPQFERALARAQAQIDAADINALSATVLDQMIEEAVIQQAAATMGISVSEEELDQMLEQDRSAISAEEWDGWLALNNLTETEYRDEVLRNGVLVTRLQQAVVGLENQTITELHARHILVSTEPEAQAVLARLNAGEDFVALAAELSNDVSTRDNGGDLDWFVPEELTIPELGEFIATLQPGQIGGPVASSLGYHILQLLETREVAFVPEEQVEVVQVTFENWLDDQLNSATIERFLN